MPSPRVALTALLLVLAGVAAAPASASTIVIEPGGRVVFTGAGDEANDLTVQDNSGIFQREVTFVVRRGRLTSFPSVGCLDRSDPDRAEDVVDCAVGSAGVLVSAGGGADTVSVDGEIPTEIPLTLDGGAGADRMFDVVQPSFTDPTGPASAGDSTLRGGDGDDVLRGGRGADELDGGSGADDVDGGEGDDRLALRDGLADRAACGGGRDAVVADTTDTLATDCESTDLLAPPARPGPSGGEPTSTEPGPSGGPQPTGTGPAPPPGQADPPAAPALARATVRVNRRGRVVRVGITCPAGCRAALTLTTNGSRRAIARARGTARPGVRRTSRLTVPRRVRARRVRLRVVLTDATGARRVVSRRLRLPGPRG